MWQSSIKQSSLLGKILANKANEIVQKNFECKTLSINGLKTEKQLEIDKIIANPEACKKFSENILQEIEELKRVKEMETAATEELKKIAESSGNLNNVRDK